MLAWDIYVRAGTNRRDSAENTKATAEIETRASLILDLINDPNEMKTLGQIAQEGFASDEQRADYWRKRAEEAEEREMSERLKAARLKDALLEIQRIATKAVNQ